MVPPPMVPVSVSICARFASKRICPLTFETVRLWSVRKIEKEASRTDAMPVRRGCSKVPPKRIATSAAPVGKRSGEMPLKTRRFSLPSMVRFWRPPGPSAAVPPKTTFVAADVAGDDLVPHLR